MVIVTVIYWYSGQCLWCCHDDEVSVIRVQLVHVLFPRVGPGHPSFPLFHLLPHLFPFYFSLSFIGFTYFLLSSILSLSTRIVPLRFQAGGRWKPPNLGLVCCV